MSVAGWRWGSLRNRSPTACDELKLYGDSLNFCVLLQSVLAEFAADSGLLEAAERGARIEDVVAIHPNRARTDAVRDRMSFLDVARPDRRRETVGGAIGALH